MKRLVTLGLFFFLFQLFVFGQKTIVDGYWQTQWNGQEGRLYSVEIDREKNRTYVTIKVFATQKQDFMNCYVWMPVLKFNDYTIYSYNYKGLLGNNGEIIKYEGYPGNYRGWKNVEYGNIFTYTLVFGAVPPPGKTRFSMEDTKGYDFSGYIVNNPLPTVPNVGMHESSLKSVINEQNDGIVGIYESLDNGLRLACIKYNGEYALVYLRSIDPDKWNEGEVKASLQETATLGLFKALWYDSNKLLEKKSVFVTFDGSMMDVIIDKKKSSYLKMYPTATSVIKKQEQEGEQPEEWTGTGFALNNGYVVTNYHVVKDAKSILISGIKGDFLSSYIAEVIATDKNNDLAIIKITDNTFKGFGQVPYSIKTTMAEVGEDVFVLGYPLTQALGDEIKLTNGIVSSRTGYQGDISTYQISAPVQPGNSGGPMFDSKGNVIGIVVAGVPGAENVGYAIKTSYLKNLIESASLNNILPTQNTVATLPLSGKVKTLKNHVFFIQCSSAQTSHVKNGKVLKVVTSPSITSCKDSRLKVNKVIVAENYTAINITAEIPPEYKNVPTAWCNINKISYIVAGDQHQGIIEAEGIALSPKYTLFNGKDVSFTLYFPPISSSIKQIDFIEPDQNGVSSWSIYGISLQ